MQHPDHTTPPLHLVHQLGAALADATEAMHAYLEWAGAMAGGPGPQGGPEDPVATQAPEINWINLDGPLRPLAGHPQQHQTGSNPQ